MDTDTRDAPIYVSLYTPKFLRWGLTVFGLAFVVLAGKDLLRALWPLNIFTPFFALLMGTGVVAGLGLMAASLWGPDERWQIDTGCLTIVQSLGTRRAERTYAAADIVTARIETIDWDSRPDTYALVLNLRSGKSLRSPHFSTLAAAELSQNRLLANAGQ